MDIAALSVGMSQGNLQQAMGVACLKMAMDSVTAGVSDVLPEASETVGMDPSLGANVDITA